MPDLSSLLSTGVAGAINPLSLIPTAVQTGMGLFQTLFSGKNKAIKELENQRDPIYKGSKPISDYYQEAKSRYGVSPYNSNQYQLAVRDATRGTATGINALQDRKGALGGINKLVGLQTDKLLNAGAQAEAARSQKFGQLGGATQMQSADDRYKFQTNELSPFNRKNQLLMMKAGSASSNKEAGISNVYSGLGNSALLLSGMKK